MKQALAFFMLIKCLSPAFAQTYLDRPLSLTGAVIRVRDALQTIEKAGNIRFSYNSVSVPADSMVSLPSGTMPLNEILEQIFDGKVEYLETGRFIILKYSPNRLRLEIERSSGTAEQYIIQGKVSDAVSGKPLKNATVVEKKLLQSVLTDSKGNFSIRFRHIPSSLSLSVSKNLYKDYSLVILPEVVVNSQTQSDDHNGRYLAGDLNRAERTRLGRLFITSSQRIQSQNLGNFIARAPVQTSLSPGLSSHGSLSGQIVNKFSLNITGGYSAGVDGAEIGLLFNINKKDVAYFQFGGAFNITGGSTRGVQIGGLYNQVIDSVSGVQISLGHNRVRADMRGFQLGGVINLNSASSHGAQLSLGYNHTAENVAGLQLAGLSNNTSGTLRGLQASLGFNRSGNSMYGVQAGLVNRAGSLRGLQVGLLNLADSASGVALGLLNLVKGGILKSGLSYSESANINLTIRSGTADFYTILAGGINLKKQKKAYSVGWGLGKEVWSSKHFAISPELSGRYFYLGDWKKVNIQTRLDMLFEYRLFKGLGIITAPALFSNISRQTQRVPGYQLLEKKRFDAGLSLGLNMSY